MAFVSVTLAYLGASFIAYQAGVVTFGHTSLFAIFFIFLTVFWTFIWLIHMVGIGLRLGLLKSAPVPKAFRRKHSDWRGPDSDDGSGPALVGAVPTRPKPTLQGGNHWPLDD